MPNMQIQPFTGLQNPQQPIGGLLTAGFNPYAQASLDAQGSPSSGLLAGMGPWSQLAYQMAGSPKQGGPYAQVAAPPTPVNTNAPGSSGGSAVGSIATGLLGSVLKNPSLLKGAYNGISGLLGGGAANGSVASILAGGSPTLSAVGTGAVAPAVDAAAADASAALGGADAGAGAVGGGLLGSAGSGTAGAGSIAAGQGAASTTAGAGIGAGIAAPLAVAGLVGLIGSGALDDKKQAAGTAAVNAWMKATGANYKTVNPPTASQASALAQGGFAAIGANYQPKTVWYGPDGKPMSNVAAQAAAYQWAQAHGMPTGDLMSPSAAQQIINSGGYGSQVYSGPTPSNSGDSWLSLLGG